MRKLIIVLGAAGLLAMSSPARADWFVAPFVGVNGGGDSGDASAASGGSPDRMILSLEILIVSPTAIMFEGLRRP